MKHLSVTQMTTVAILTAVTCVLGPLSIPIGAVPISFTNLAIYISLYLLGMKLGTLSYVIYLFIGLVGVPVFSSFTGGAGKLFGPTGGYLVGFIFLALIAGFFIERYPKRPVICFLGMVLGTAVCYAFGTAWLAYEASLSFQAALFAGVIPFLPGDFAKIIISIFLGSKLRTALQKANVLPETTITANEEA